MTRRIACFVMIAASLGAAAPAAALVGGAPLASDAWAKTVVLIVGSRGSSCTGVALARDLILTAAHCVLPGIDYKLVEFGADRRPILKNIGRIARHPQFSLKTMLGHRATADVALIKLLKPENLTPVALGGQSRDVKVGDAFLVIGYGLTVPNDGKSGGKVRSAQLVATGRPGTLQIRLVDPQTNNQRAGLGACTGDSGAPVFARAAPFAVTGVVSWSTAAGNAAGCGGLTGVTPLYRYRQWIVDTARAMGSPVR